MAALMPLVGIVTILHARRKRRHADAEPVDADFEKRREAARESERRMAAYLAQREPARYDADTGGTEQESRR